MSEQYTDTSPIDPMEDTEPQPEQAETYLDGETAPFIVTKNKVWKPEDLKKEDPELISTILGLVKQFTASEDIARRLSVLQVWEARHFDRGYQHLQGGNKGGWQVAGISNNKNDNFIENADDNNLYATNLLSGQGDIVTGVMNRGAIKVSFRPATSDKMDSTAADEANKYKHIWYEANDSVELQRTTAGILWTDPRVVYWTRSIKDKSRFGTCINSQGKEVVRTVEITSPFGVLETKLPMMRDSIHEMSYANIYEEIDYTTARSMFPWAEDKIEPSTGSSAETTFEKVARINTKSGLIGTFLVGTNSQRDSTVCYSWQRQGNFYAKEVKSGQRKFLLENFTNGLFAIVINDNLICCWEESMDDHLALGMATRGFGQNRRALCSSDIPIQKRINIWADLWDKYIRGSIPMTILDDQAFNTEAMAELRSDPQRFVSAVPPQGQTVQSLVGQTPQAQPLPGFLELFQMYTGPILQSSDGATPTLQGNAEGPTDTVGGTQMRLNQSLERIGPVWMAMNKMTEVAVTQAARLCAENGEGEVTGLYDGDQDISVKPENLKGNFKARAETTNAIPESGTQTEAKLMMILDLANSNQGVAELISKPSNAKNIVLGLHLDNIITVEESGSVDKQNKEIIKLISESPLINPEWDKLNNQLSQLNQTHESAKELAIKATQSGQQLSPEIIQQGDQMESQVQQLTQQLSNIPQYLCSIPAETDESVDHATEADTCFQWMNDCDGASLRAKALNKEFGNEDWDHFNNVLLHWQGHTDMMKKISSQNQQTQVPKLSVSAKASPIQVSQILAAAGIQTDPNEKPNPTETETEEISRTPFHEVKKTTRPRKL